MLCPPSNRRFVQSEVAAKARAVPKAARALFAANLKRVRRMITFGGGTIPLARLLLYEDLLEERFHVLMRLLHSGLVVADRRTLS